jgi:DNA polymerase-4
MFLAKVASDMQKPDGCVVIEPHELPEKLYALELRDLYGIGRQTEKRLNRNNILSVRDLYAMNPQQLRAAWGSIEGERLYEKLRGLEPYEISHPRRSLGHSHVLPPELRTPKGALSVLHRLLQKACMRLRNYDLHASTIRISIKFMDEPGWSAESACTSTDDTLQLIQALNTLWQRFPDNAPAPYKAGISLSRLAEPRNGTLALFQQPRRVSKHSLNEALDALNMRYGKNAVYFGGAHNALNNAPMRIAFNHIPDPVIEGDASTESRS